MGRGAKAQGISFVKGSVGNGGEVACNVSTAHGNLGSLPADSLPSNLVSSGSKPRRAALGISIPRVPPRSLYTFS